MLQGGCPRGAYRDGECTVGWVMAQETLLFIVFTVLGVYGVRWTLRLAPLNSELPLKTLLATVLCGLLVGLELTSSPVTPLLRWLALILGPLYILSPFALTALARARLYPLAKGLLNVLYWSPSGREGMARLLAQVALRQDDPEVALSLLPEGGGDTLRLQAYALQERWQEVLTMPVPEVGDNAFLGLAARIEALLAQGRETNAETELNAMEARWQAQGQGPLGYRAVTLSKARLFAYRGQLSEARDELQNPLPGVPPYRVLETLAFAAERAHNPEAAGRLYAQAYTYAPPGHRERLGQALVRYGQSVPEAAKPSRPYATAGLAAFLVALYLVQLWAGTRFSTNAWAAAAGFLTVNPGAPGGDALWRYLSYAFVHGGLLHIGLNVWVLLDIGRLYEARRLWGNIIVAFVFGSVLGAYLTFVVQGGAPPGVIGASGGVLGVGGALLADVLRGRGTQDRLLTRSLLQWIGLIVIFSVAIPGVSLWGHVGGLIGGLLWGFIRQGLPKTRQVDLFSGVLGIALIAYALYGSLSWLFRYGGQL